MTEEQTTTETNRDRVRRLFINPMIELGFRFPHRTPEDIVRKRLDRMADDLGYLTDENLRRVRSRPSTTSSVRSANRAIPSPRSG